MLLMQFKALFRSVSSRNCGKFPQLPWYLRFCVCRFDRIERLKKLVVVVGAVETVEKSEK